MSIRHRSLTKSFLLALFFLSNWFLLSHSQKSWAEELSDDTYTGSSFNHIYEQVFSDPYEELPFYKVDSAQFGKAGDRPENNVLQAGLRSLTLERDLFDFPNGQKLFQANGICFSGHWTIDTPSIFTGLYAQGIQVPVIARASVALNGTLQKNKRAFGVAIKLFSTQDPTQPVKTQNLFVLHSLGGTITKHVLDLPMDNAPSLGSIPPLWQLRKALRLQKDFERADEQISGNQADVAFRPVTHLAETSVSGGAPPTMPIVAPTWVRLKAPENLPRMDQNDFRDELRVEQYPQSQLIWTIEVAHGDRNNKKDANWQSIGKLILNQSITSKTCDQRLFFKHPQMPAISQLE